MPDILINGGGHNANGGISGLLGLQLLEQIGKKKEEVKISHRGCLKKAASLLYTRHQ